MEWLDIVDQDDVVVRCTDREAYTGSAEGWIRCSAVFLANPNGQIWVPTRASSKQLFPRCLDASVCGHVQAGESYLAAAIRETEEETGLCLPASRFRLLETLHPQKDRTFCFMSVFVVYLERETPSLSPKDHDAVTWMGPAELLELLESGAPARSDLARMVQCLASLAPV